MPKKKAAKVPAPKPPKKTPEEAKFHRTMKAIAASIFESLDHGTWTEATLRGCEHPVTGERFTEYRLMKNADVVTTQAPKRLLARFLAAWELREGFPERWYGVQVAVWADGMFETTFDHDRNAYQTLFADGGGPA